MTDPDAVLHRIDDVIDGATDDFEVSGDAMRWAPPDVPDEMHRILRNSSTELRLQRFAENVRRELHEAIEHLRLVGTFATVLPDPAERADLLDAAGGDLQRAISLAQWGIPAQLAAANPGADIHRLASMAVQDDYQEKHEIR